ncbi:cystathionine beta-lyase [Methanobrevibacter sp. 87.7]|uniref:MalY/PatB family protein n=1 Tax=Methanobrevibacter sp. 87.7 TaxID=387957 RepID=UPI000B51095E|nr:MalY/PatB family protein [Methanobrevibacter sp. 87.7]OWT32489.1 cystathionine beta-lyase [Methanobrevibacter sp. 87.7]
MKYDFKTINRNNTNSLKWDLFSDKFPMWVADMDFKVAPPIFDAILNRINHKVYGYFIISDDLYDAYINWWKFYGLNMSKDELLFSIGVMPAITSIIREFTSFGDEILIQTPVYHVFFNVILNNNRKVIENPLVYDKDTLSYSIDFDDLEEKLSNPNTKMMLLCNPHNPIGKIWSRKDLVKIGQLCWKYNVILVSDEIHCDLTNPGKQYIPFASLDDELTGEEIENSLTCISPSKTFNIAGFQNSMVFTKNKEFYSRLEGRLMTDFFSGPNVLSVDVAIAAYNNCKDWLHELKQVLFENKKIVNDFLINEVPDVKLVQSDATYLLWLDCSSLNMDSNSLSEFLRKEKGVFLSPGIQFGRNGDNFLRMNIACPKELLNKELLAFKEGINLLKN